MTLTIIDQYNEWAEVNGVEAQVEGVDFIAAEWGHRLTSD